MTSLASNSEATVGPGAPGDGEDAGHVALDRMAAADGAAALDRLQGSPLLAEGRVNLINLEAVRSRLGERWNLKREQIWEHVERSFQRQIGNAAYAVRVSETDYMVALPEMGRYAGQAACLSVLREVLTFFLGDSRKADLSLREVVSLTPEGVAFRPIDPMALRSDADGDYVAPEPAAISPPGAAARTPGLIGAAKIGRRPAERSSEDASPDRWSPFVAGDGRELKVSCHMEPVFEMQQIRLVGHRVESSVTEVATGATLDAASIRALSPGDRERVDLATIARGVSRLRSADPSTRKPLLILPAAFSTLGATRGRVALSLALREAKLDATTRIVCEIRELEGVPTGRVIESVSLIKPFCYAVVGRGSEDKRLIEAIAKGGFNGLSIELTNVRDDNDLLTRLHAFATLAKKKAKVVMAFGLTTPRHLALARLAGATHASMTHDAALAGSATDGGVTIPTR